MSVRHKRMSLDTDNSFASDQLCIRACFGPGTFGSSHSCKAGLIPSTLQPDGKTMMATTGILPKNPGIDPAMGTTSEPLRIHPTSVIDSSCRLASMVEIGPFCVIGPAVVIGKRTKLFSHVSIMASTTIGEDCTIFPNAVLGAPAQVHKSNASGSSLSIGDRVTVREGVTVHLSNMGHDKPTRIGNDCLLMANVHIAHDCHVGDNVTLVQGVGLAGHVVIRDGATLGGLAGLHQYVVVGENAFVGGGAMVTHDVLPYSIVSGNRARTTGLNVVGLKRKGWQDTRIAALQAAVQEYFRTGHIQYTDDTGDCNMLRAFLAATKRGVCSPAASLISSTSKI